MDPAETIQNGAVFNIVSEPFSIVSALFASTLHACIRFDAVFDDFDAVFDHFGTSFDRFGRFGYEHQNPELTFVRN